MAYIPTIWGSGDVVTSEKLNKIENGIKDNSEITGCLIINANIDNDTGNLVLNKTAGELYNTNIPVFAYIETDFTETKMLGFMTASYNSDNDYAFTFLCVQGESELGIYLFTTDGGGNAYPVYEVEPDQPIG